MQQDRPVRIAVDIGGTFTDLQILDARHGQMRAWKTPTTPQNPSEGLLLHGTTIATNAVLERRLARGVLVTAPGFEDVPEITRHAHRDIYGLAHAPFPCRPPRDRRLGYVA